MTNLILNNHSAADANLFFDPRGRGLVRYDKPRYPNIAKWDTTARGYFWRPSAIPMAGERASYLAATDAEQFIFKANISRQIMLDTVQGHSPSLLFLPHCTNPELENAIQTWSFFETIHSESYTHVLRAIFDDPSEVFDAIPNIAPIVEAGASIAGYYEPMMTNPNKENLVAALVAANALEAIRFYVSFACTFSMGERGIVPQAAEIVRLIAQDEVLHVALPKMLLKLLPKEDPEYGQILGDRRADFVDIFERSAEEEKEWVEYLFQHGVIPGLNKDILRSYIDYQKEKSLHGLGLSFKIIPNNENPLAWMSKRWLTNDASQTAAQEQPLVSYMSGAVNSTVEAADVDDIFRAG